NSRKFDHPNGTKSIVIKKFADPFRNEYRGQEVLQEIELLSTIKHENIAPFLGCYVVNENPAVAAAGDQACRGKSGGAFSQKTRVIHIQIVHRNLHPGNICIDIHKKLTIIVDVWSVAALLCQIISGVGLFNADDVLATLERQIQHCGIIPHDLLDKVEH
ncbi:hypothetical protein PMAYCL1PPCAC_09324, partial [Pristionchus mayeri]